MDYKEVKQRLKKEFTNIFMKYDFKGKSSSQGCEFKSEQEYTSKIIGYGIRNYVNEFKTGCYLGIDIHIIQKIEKKIFEGSYYGTLSSGIADYFGVVNYDFTIRNEQDIAVWMEIVSKFYIEFAEPFFSKFQDVADVDVLLNANPKERVPELNDLGQHIIKGLISAKLNDNPNYDELKAYYQSEVESKFKGHFLYDNCMKVIAFLDSHTTEELKSIS